jgi:hypothetical protein
LIDDGVYTHTCSAHHLADTTPHRYAESEGSNFGEEEDSDAAAPRE